MRLATLLIVLSVGLSSTVLAQPEDEEGPVQSADPEGSSPENLEATREARARFESGMQFFQNRRFREAIREFELAAQLVPSADLWFNIARAHEEIREYERAVEHYRRYLRDRVDPPDRERVEAHITELEEAAAQAHAARQRRPTSGTLQISTSTEGANVHVDDDDIGISPIAAPLSVQPGRHRIAARQEGYLPFDSEVNVRPGVTTAAHARMEPRTEYEASRGTPIFTWVAAGLSAVSLGMSIFFGAQASSLQDEGLEILANAMPEPNPQDISQFHDARDRATLSDVFLGTAVGLALSAVALYFLESSTVDTEQVSGAQVAENDVDEE